MKKISIKHFLLPIPVVLLMFAGCDDSSLVKKTTADAGSSVVADTGAPAKQPAGTCTPSKCPHPAQGIPCCTPTAGCGTDPTGLGLGCTPNPGANVSSQECILKECPAPAIGNKCCTPLGECGWDPFMNGVFCFNTPPAVDAAPPPPTCALDKCPTPIGSIKPCCLPGTESKEPGVNCGWDTLGIGFCFPPPVPLCNLDACPHQDGGPAACCLPNGKCGLDTLGIGFCFPPPPEATCQLDTCAQPPNGIKACCLPNGDCGWDSLNVGICFPPPPPIPDAGPPPPPVTTPPDDPSITRDCPSFIGIFGPQWGCCSPYGVCGTFFGGQCSLAIGAQIPNGPPPTADAGKEPFLRCTPPKIDAGH